MPRGDVAKRWRTWINDEGVEVRSRGRPSAAEIAARTRKEDKEVNKKEVKEVTYPFPPKIENKTNPKRFIEGANNAIQGLKVAFDNSINDKEGLLIKGMIAIIENQMLPKYKDQLKVNTF